jgi:phage gp36-like protein
LAAGTALGAAVDIGIRNAAWALLDVTAVSGPTPALTATIQTSPNGTTDWVSVPGSILANALGYARAVLTGMERFIRVQTVVSAGASFTAGLSATAEVLYAQPSDIANLGLPAAALSLPVTPMIQAEILRSNTSLIESYCRGRYRLPFTAVPPELKAACVAISVYDVLVWRGFNPDEYDSNFKIRRDFYVGNERTKGWLDKLSAGAVSIDAMLDATPGQREGGAQIRGRKLRGWFAPDGSDDDAV